MADLNFPLNPQVNDIYTFNGRSYKYDGSKWRFVTLSLTTIITGTAITSINSLTNSAQDFFVGVSGSGFNISSVGSSHTFNIPFAGSASTGLITTASQTIAGAKTFSSNLLVSSSTASTNTTTGALTVTGGAGFGDSINIAGRLNLWNGSSYSSFVSSASGNTVYTLPSTSPAVGTSVLQSTSAGVMSWVPMTATSGSSGSATTATNVNLVSAISNAAHPIIFSPSSSGSGVALSSNTLLSFNPSNNILSVSGLAVTSGLASTSSSTGALTVTGGVGIGASLFVGTTIGVNTGTSGLLLQKLVAGNSGAIYSAGVTPSQTNYTLITDGAAASVNGTTGVYVNISNNNKIQVTTNNINIVPTAASTSSSTGSLTVAGGVGIGGSLYVASATAISGVTFNNGFINGTWAGSTITSYYGGTGYNSFTKGDILVGSGNTLSKFPVGNDLTILAADSTSGYGITWKGLLSPTYGAFGSTAIQLVSAANTETLVTYNTTYEANKVSIGSGTTTRVYINDSGVFNVQFSAQLSLAAGTQPKNVDMWFKINGTNVPLSNTRQTIQAKDQDTVFALNFVSTFISGQYVELAFSSPDANLQFGTFTGLTLPTRPDIPSMILTVTPVSSILPGSGSAITGLASLNLLTANAQTLTTGTSGVDFNIVSSGSVHTYNIPDASTSARGFITTGSQTLIGSKTFASGVAITSTIASTSTTTGALSISGGVGIGGSLYVSSATAISGVTINNGIITGSLTGTATTAQNVNVVNATTNAAHTLRFSPSATGSGLATSSNTALSFNPSTLILSTSGLAITAGTASTNSSTGALVVTGGVGIGGSLFVAGDLTINGTTTTINSVTLTVDDKNIELGSVTSPSDVTAEGGGITLKGATDKSINWYTGTGWSSSESWNLVSGSTYKINNTTVLSNTSLGTGVTNSSLTALGTIVTGVWAGTSITAYYGGTGLQTAFTVGDILYANTSSTWARLTANSNSGYVLTSAGSGATPTYVAQSTLSVGNATTSGIATTATNINVVLASTNASHPVLFTPTFNTGSGLAVSSNTTLVYNPSTDILSVSGMAVTSGTASTTATTGSFIATGGVGIGQSLSIGGRLQLFNGANYTAFVSSASGNTVYTLPATTPATGSSVLQSNSGGVLSWTPMTSSGVAVSGGTDGVVQFKVGSGLGATTSLFFDTALLGLRISGFPGGNSPSGTDAALKVEQTTSSFNGSLNGTMIAVNANTGFTGDLMNLQVNASSKFRIDNTGAIIQNIGTNSTNTTSGAVQIKGGVGITGAVYVGESINATSTTTSTSTSTGSLVVSGGAGFAGTINVGGTAKIFASTASSNTWTGALLVGGGVGISGQLTFAQASLGYTGITTNPSMSFIGNTSSSPITLTVLTDNSLNFEGSQGSVFSIDSNLSSGEIFAVSDISGLPIISASAGQTVNFNEFGGYTQFGNGTLNSSSTSTGAVVIAGGLGMTGNANFGGTVLISNTTQPGYGSTTSGAFVVTGGVGIGGPVYIGGQLGVGGTLDYNATGNVAFFAGNSNSYTQVIVHNHNAGNNASSDYIVSNDSTTDTTYFGDFGINSSGWAATTSAFNTANAVYLASNSGDLAIGSLTTNPIRFFYNNGTSDAVVFGGTAATVYYGTNSTSTISGALQVKGGLGITGNAFIGGTTTITSTTASTSITSGALTVSGGVGIGQTLFVGGNISSASYFYSGGNNFTKAGQAQGDIFLDNNTNDTPGLLYYYKNNTNFGVDVYATGTGTTRYRIVRDLNESTGAEIWSIDRTGVVTRTAWDVGEVINTRVYNYSDLNMSATTTINTTTYTNVATITYTQKSSTSYLWIEFDANYDYSNGTTNDDFFSRITVGGSVISERNQIMVGQVGGGTRSGVIFPISGRYTNSATSGIAITVQARWGSSDDAIRVYGSSTSGYMRIQEIGR